AVTAAALALVPTEVMVILPSDHVIDDLDAFRAAVTTASRLASSGGIVTFGVVPTRPDTGYGYIEIGDPVEDGAHRVARFREKPGEDVARAMSSDGRHLWNWGEFVVTAGTVLYELEQSHPKIMTAVGDGLTWVDGGVIEL